MDTSRLPAKSILKQQAPKTKPTLSDEQKAKADLNKRNLGIALHHANKIQERKNIEAQILSSIEILLDFPSHPTLSQGETSSFISFISLFQPSDFAALVEERNAEQKCGYVLCANQPRSLTLVAKGGSWKLKGEGAANYCSQDCMRKALYVKAQLSEVPAWERAEAGVREVRVELLDQHVGVDGGRGVEDERRVGERELALERGEPIGSLRKGQVVADRIVEKANVSAPTANVEEGDESTYDSIEGWVPMQSSTHMKKVQAPQSALSSAVSREDSGQRHHEPSDPAEEEEDSWKALYENLPQR